MADHLSDAVLARYYDGTLPAAELLSADDHLAGCDTCRARGEALVHAESPMRPASAFMAADAGDHLDPLMLEAFVEGRLDPVDREIVDTHVLDCAACAEDVGDIRQARAMISAIPTTSRAGRRWFRRPAFMVGLASAAALTFAVLLSWPGRNPVSPAPASSGSEVTAAVQPVPVDRGWKTSLRDGPFTVGIDADGRLAGLPDVASVDADALRRALVDGRVSLSGANDLSGRTGTLLGPSEQSSRLSLLTPVGTVVESTQPVLRWTAVAGATSYRVAVFDDRFAEVASSGEIVSRAWTPPAPLRRGRTYVWQVTASTPGGAVHAPVPPAPEARFRVLDAAGAERLSAIRTAAKGSHLVLGVAYAEAGLRDAAEQELRALLDANPDSPIARALLASVRSGG